MCISQTKEPAAREKAQAQATEAAGLLGRRQVRTQHTPRRECAGEGALLGFRCPLHLENFDKTTKKAAPSLCHFLISYGLLS